MGTGLNMLEPGPRRTVGAGWPDPARRILVVAAIAAAIAVAAWGPVLRLAGLVGAGDWGSDWNWLADGLDRLARGLPLNHPAYVTAPFSQLDGGPAYTWSLHPPWNATLLSPLLLIPADLRLAAWTTIMAAVAVAAVGVAWPRRAWWGSSLLIAAAVLGAPFGGLWEGLVDQVHYANPNALVMLGVVLVWKGRRERRTSLIAVGLVLAAVKVVPAVGMVAWLLAGRSGRPAILRGLATAAGVLVALTIPVVLLDPGVLGDTIAVALNLVPWDGPTNLAPQVRLAPLIGFDAATWLSRAVALALLVVILVRRLDGPGGFVLAAAAPLLMTPQLWAHWLLIPALAIITTLDASGTFLRIDRAIRAAGAGPTPAPGALPAPGASPGSGALPVPGGDLGGTRPVRAFFAVAGTCFLALGVLGIVLPILPTTPFLLLAVASYARASVRLHAWLLSNRRFGPVIRSWQESRSLPPGARPRAIAVIAISFGVSIILVGDPLLRAGLAGGGLVLMAFVARLPERP